MGHARPYLSAEEGTGVGDRWSVRETVKPGSRFNVRKRSRGKNLTEVSNHRGASQALLDFKLCFRFDRKLLVAHNITWLTLLRGELATCEQ